MADETYVRQLKATLNARRSADEEKTRKENREAEIIKENAPKQWIKLKEWLRDTVAQVNQGNPAPDLSYDEDGHNLDEVKIWCRIGQNRQELTVSFVGLFGGPITVLGGKVNLEFNSEVDGRELRWADATHRFFSVEDMGQKILDSAVNL